MPVFINMPSLSPTMKEGKLSKWLINKGDKITSGDVIAEITSAEMLTDQQKNGIKEKLKSILGEKLSLNFNIDNNVIGGLIVKIGSKMIDNSLNSKISKLTIAMKGV